MKRIFDRLWKKKKRCVRPYAVYKENKMISPAERKTPPIKVAGYLEKRSKMRVVCRWKKLWFVLEGRLLLYYKSKLEYLSLSPCRGTVNLGLAASVSPGKSNEIIVSTRSNTVSLRALNRSDHDIWLQALMDAMHLPNTNHTICCTKPVRHFRYSTGGLEDQSGRTYGDYLMNHAHTLSGRLSPVVQKTYEFSERRKQSQSGAVDLKLDQLARRFSRITASDTTIPEHFKSNSTNSFKTNILRRSVSVEDEFNRYSENIYETVDSNRYSRSKFPRRVMRSDSDCLMTRERTGRQPVFRSEQRIKTVYDSTNLSEQDAFVELLNHTRLGRCENHFEKPLRMKFGSACGLEKKKDVKSDTDLALRKQDDLYLSGGSCNVIYRTPECRNLTESHDCYQYPEYSRNSELYFGGASKKPKRSNSILKNFLRSKNDSCNPLTKKTSVKRRSLSFLKRIWKRKEPKLDDDISFNTEENDMQEIHHPLSDLASSSVYSAVDVSMEYEAPMPEPPPDYGQFTDVEDSVPELPPRQTRGPTPWEDPPQPKTPEEPPALPIKMRNKRKATALDFLFQDGWDPGLRRLFNEPEDNNSQKELSEIMAQLADINAAPLKYTITQEKKCDEEPDYDIPRPHDSLLLDLQKNTPVQDMLQPTHFFSHFEDSLDIPHASEPNDDFTMAPDSLECDPWSSETESNYNTWTPQTQIRKTIITSTYGTNRETYFQDTVNMSHNEKNYVNIPNSFIKLHT